LIADSLVAAGDESAQRRATDCLDCKVLEATLAISLSSVIRQTMPAIIKTLLRPPYFYLQRLRLWAMIALHTKPIDAAARSALFRSLIAAPFTALRNLGQWENPRLLENARLKVAPYGLFYCRAGTDDLFHVLPDAQPGVLGAIEKHLAAGDTFIDAGANIGFFTVVGAKMVGRQGKVIAVEMIPETVQRLCWHISINELDNVTVIDQALSDKAGEEITALLPTAHNGQATLVPEALDGEPAVEICVTTTTLDAITDGIERIDLIKIDLEGGELLALKGASLTLGRTRRVIFEARPGDKRVSEAVNLLKSAGFRITPIDKYNRLAER
jgi:FkbM family methyltransferase